MRTWAKSYFSIQFNFIEYFIEYCYLSNAPTDHVANAGLPSCGYGGEALLPATAESKATPQSISSAVGLFMSCSIMSSSMMSMLIRVCTYIKLCPTLITFHSNSYNNWQLQLTNTHFLFFKGRLNNVDIKMYWKFKDKLISDPKKIRASLSAICKSDIDSIDDYWGNWQ